MRQPPRNRSDIGRENRRAVLSAIVLDGPLPRTAERSKPACCAMRRANGLANTRVPFAGAAAGAGCVAGAAGGGGADATGSATCAAAAGAGAAAAG